MPKMWRFLRINESEELFPGGKEREEAYCPNAIMKFIHQ